MSLYIRLNTSFWNHRKTIRLRSKLGDAAFWIPPRLWSYAAENQPDGDFTDYTAEEIALLVGFPSNAQEMLEALQQAQFLDGMKIHDWPTHNGYHVIFADRAKKAAQARWEKERSKERAEEDPEKGKDKSKHCFKHASSILPADLSSHDAFPGAWQRWEDHCEEIDKRLTRSARESIWLDCRRQGLDRACKAIAFSLSQSAKNIIWDFDSHRNGNSAPTPRKRNPHNL
jgi:hypothetical protein